MKKKRDLRAEYRAMLKKEEEAQAGKTFYLINRMIFTVFIIGLLLVVLNYCFESGNWITMLFAGPVIARSYAMVENILGGW